MLVEMKYVIILSFLSFPPRSHLNAFIKCDLDIILLDPFMAFISFAHGIMPSNMVCKTSVFEKRPAKNQTTYNCFKVEIL